MACVRILIADDHELVRRGLRALLAARPAWEVCGEAADGVEAIEKAAQLRPDIVLLDVSMPRLGGLEAASAIRRESPASQILIVSQHDPAEMLPSALEAGARGFLSKSDIGSTLLSTIESIVERPATLERHPRRPAASAAAAHAPAAPERPAPAGAQRHRTETLLLEQNYLLELIARGRPLDDCLRAITDSVTHLQPGMRAVVMLAGPGCTGIERVISARLPPDLTAELSKLPFDDPATPIPRKAVLLEGEAITVADIESDARWAGCWRAIWTAHGVKALHATPVCTVDGTITAAFFVCLAEARHPSPWERDLAQFGAHLASLVIERRRAEEAVRESEHKFRTLFESIDQGLCVLERVPDTARGRVDFRFLQANAGFTVQTGAGDLVGRTLREACPEEPEEAFLTYEHVLRSGESRKFERGQLDRGRVLELYAFRVDDGLQARLAVIVKDITERKRAEAFMLCQKRAFEQAASGMPLMEVLEFLARRTELHLGDKPRVAIHLLDPAGERFLRAAAPSLPADYCEGVSGVRRGAANDPCGVAVARGERLSVLAARHNQTFPGYAAFAARHGIESGWFLPISSSRGQALGVIACHYRDAR
ncbi:MAG: response regulator, partial [Gammaproteobacteria bacterium]|nr:response regulator [Gammaproteobacteria bacterium]